MFRYFAVLRGMCFVWCFSLYVCVGVVFKVVLEWFFERYFSVLSGVFRYLSGIEWLFFGLLRYRPVCVLSVFQQQFSLRVTLVTSVTFHRQQWRHP